MIASLFQLCQERQASDMHLVRDEPPVMRVHGTLYRMDLPALRAPELEGMLLAMLTESQREQFSRYSDVDFAFSLPGSDRYRVNVHRERGAVEAAFRRLPREIPSLEELGLPPVAAGLTRMARGLVLVTGPVGTGKSTTMAAMVNQINNERDGLVVSIEDPIEYVHENKRSIIKQREVTVDTPSFELALKHALRQDPNVIVIGEMRDLETIAIALTAAETGHLVLATLHTPDATQSVQRIIDVFPAHKQNQARTQLAECLQGIIAQLLLPSANGLGRVLACETLVVTPAVRNMIREEQLQQIPTVIQTGGKLGMRTMDKALKQLVDKQAITRDAALSKAKFPEDFDQL